MKKSTNHTRVLSIYFDLHLEINMSEIGFTFCGIELCGILTMNLAKYVLCGILNIFNLADVKIPCEIIFNL